MDTRQLFEKFLHLARKHARGNLGAASPSSLVSELGLDSLALMETIADLETELGIMIPDEDLIRLRTLGDFVDRVAHLVGSRPCADRV